MREFGFSPLILMQQFQSLNLQTQQKTKIIFICFNCQILLEQFRILSSSMTNAYTRKKIENYSYGLSDVIGKGYSSQVFKGRNDSNTDSVAVKVIDMRMLKNQINQILLDSEILVLKQLKALPHILTLHDVFTTKNNTYLITELCDSDLSKLIKNGLPEPQACQFMDQIITGYLNFARKQIIHRDLKPANILITQNQQLKIADFGFAIKTVDAHKSNKYNVGSPLYMAPQSLKRNEYSLKTDIWALGVIFYEILTGETPWKAKTQKELIKKIESQTIESLLTKINLSAVSKDFLKRTLKLDKASRLEVEELTSFNFGGSQNQNILMQKKLNINFKPNSMENFNSSIFSPKVDKSVENRLFIDRSCDKRLPSKDISDKKFTTFRYDSINQSLQVKPTLSNKFSPSINLDLKKRQSNYTDCKENPQNTLPANTSKKQTSFDKKQISKILISQIHFCRFLYKLLTRILESSQTGLLKFSKDQADKVICDYMGIIRHKIQNLINFKNSNFINCQNYNQYKQTSDFIKLMKIAKQYRDRYQSEMRNYWNNSKCSFSTENTVSLISFSQRLLHLKEDQPGFVQNFSSDIVILDYLMTSKQLIDIFQNGQNYEKFSKKSRIEEIVQGKTADISFDLYTKIANRAKQILGVTKQVQRQERDVLLLA